MLIHLPLVILSFIYSIILIREDDRRLTKVLAIILLATSSFRIACNSCNGNETINRKLLVLFPLHFILSMI